MLRCLLLLTVDHYFSSGDSETRKIAHFMPKCVLPHTMNVKCYPTCHVILQHVTKNSRHVPEICEKFRKKLRFSGAQKTENDTNKKCWRAMLHYSLKSPKQLLEAR